MESFLCTPSTRWDRLVAILEDVEPSLVINAPYFIENKKAMKMSDVEFFYYFLVCYQDRHSKILGRVLSLYIFAESWRQWLKETHRSLQAYAQEFGYTFSYHRVLHDAGPNQRSETLARKIQMRCPSLHSSAATGSTTTSAANPASVLARTADDPHPRSSLSKKVVRKQNRHKDNMASMLAIGLTGGRVGGMGLTSGGRTGCGPKLPESHIARARTCVPSSSAGGSPLAAGGDRGVGSCLNRRVESMPPTSFPSTTTSSSNSVDLCSRSNTMMMSTTTLDDQNDGEADDDDEEGREQSRVIDLLLDGENESKSMVEFLRSGEFLCQLIIDLIELQEELCMASPLTRQSTSIGSGGSGGGGGGQGPGNTSSTAFPTATVAVPTHTSHSVAGRNVAAGSGYSQGFYYTAAASAAAASQPRYPPVPSPHSAYLKQFPSLSEGGITSECNTTTTNNNNSHNALDSTLGGGNGECGSARRGGWTSQLSAPGSPLPDPVRHQPRNTADVRPAVSLVNAHERSDFFIKGLNKLCTQCLNMSSKLMFGGEEEFFDPKLFNPSGSRTELLTREDLKALHRLHWLSITLYKLIGDEKVVPRPSVVSLIFTNEIKRIPQRLAEDEEVGFRIATLVSCLPHGITLEVTYQNHQLHCRNLRDASVGPSTYFCVIMGEEVYAYFRPVKSFLPVAVVLKWLLETWDHIPWTFGMNATTRQRLQQLQLSPPESMTAAQGSFVWGTSNSNSTEAVEPRGRRSPRSHPQQHQHQRHSPHHHPRQDKYRLQEPPSSLSHRSLGKSSLGFPVIPVLQSTPMPSAILSPATHGAPVTATTAKQLPNEETEGGRFPDSLEALQGYASLKDGPEDLIDSHSPDYANPHRDIPFFLEASPTHSATIQLTPTTHVSGGGAGGEMEKTFDLTVHHKSLSGTSECSKGQKPRATTTIYTATEEGESNPDGDGGACSLAATEHNNHSSSGFGGPSLSSFTDPGQRLMRGGAANISLCSLSRRSIRISGGGRLPGSSASALLVAGGGAATESAAVSNQPLPTDAAGSVAGSHPSIAAEREEMSSMESPYFTNGVGGTGGALSNTSMFSNVQMRRADFSATIVSENQKTGIEVIAHHFRIRGDLIGKGAFGAVFKALDLETGAMVAVKQSRYTYDGVKQNLNWQEFELWSMLPPHPNVITFHGASIDERTKQIMLVLEYASGGSIKSLYTDFAPINAKLLFQHAKGIALGLNHLHDHSVRHGDVKPENVLTRSDGSVAISDFGCSRVQYELHRASVMMKGTGGAGGRMRGGGDGGGILAGTIAYMAPEVAASEPALTSDVWAYACTLIHLWTGESPWCQSFPSYNDREPVALLYYLCTTDSAVPYTKEQIARTPEWLQKIAWRAFERDPAKRCTMREILTMFSTWE